jgi:hypothetical protein
MAASSMRFVPPYDVHLLRGQALQILKGGNAAFTDLLEIDGQDAQIYLSAHATSTLRFSFSFKESDAANFNISLPVTNPNGLITLLPAEPTVAKFRIRNFNLFVELTETTGTVTSKIQTAIRIHIHNRIDKVWISPNPMTVSRGQLGQPSLRARFDDDVVAEISNIPRSIPGNRATYNITSLVVIQWSSNPVNLIDQNEGWLDNSTALNTFIITASVAFNNRTLTTDGDILISEVLSKNSPHRAELVATGNSPGFVLLDKIPNIIFIPDGFRRDDQTTGILDETNFNLLVDDYVKKLVDNQITEPFKILKGSINYWKLFLPSRESGTTYRGDVYVETGQPNPSGHYIPFIADPGALTADKWSPEHLLFMVGLPVRAEMFSATANAQILTDLLTNQITLLRANSALMLKWQKYADRRLPEVRDTVLGITVNNYLAATDDGFYNLLNLEVTRVFRIGLDRLFFSLQDNRGHSIGHVFNSDFFISQGKDRSNVVILSPASQGRDQNTGQGMFCRTDTALNNLLLSLQADLIASVIPPAIPQKLPLDPTGTITHEISHSFGLGDEYGENLPQFDNKPVSDPALAGVPFVNFVQSDARLLDMKSNLQARIDLKGTIPLDPTKLKWRYPRIETCRTVTAIKLLNPTTLELTLASGQLSTFRTGDPVFLRKRKKNPMRYFIHLKGNPTRLATLLDPDPFPIHLQTTIHIDAVLSDERIRVKYDTVSFGPQTGEMQVEKGQTAGMPVGQEIEIKFEVFFSPIHSIFRTPSTTPGAPDQIENAISAQLTVATVSAISMTVTIPANTTVSAYLQSLTNKEEMVVYKPVSLPAGQRSATYPFAELISKKVLDQLITSPIPFNTNVQNQEFVHMRTFTRIPAALASSSPRQKEIIGLYSGGEAHHGGVYHPAGQCMMRFQVENGVYTSLCAVCRYTMISQINPSRFPEFDRDYMARNIYPQ